MTLTIRKVLYQIHSYGFTKGTAAFDEEGNEYILIGHQWEPYHKPQYDMAHWGL
jgi:hypothetical protein